MHPPTHDELSRELARKRTVFRGWGLLQNDVVIAIVPAPAHVPSAYKFAAPVPGPVPPAPVLSDRAQAEGLRWAPLFEAEL